MTKRRTEALLHLSMAGLAVWLAVFAAATTYSDPDAYLIGGSILPARVLTIAGAALCAATGAPLLVQGVGTLISRGRRRFGMIPWIAHAKLERSEWKVLLVVSAVPILLGVCGFVWSEGSAFWSDGTALSRVNYLWLSWLGVHLLL